MLATLAEAVSLLTQFEARLVDIVLLSLRVSGTAVAIGALNPACDNDKSAPFISADRVDP